uniref:Uncharacterized protein n=1 Tax=viral metagenome TaxID=1070528 RepID=A0A6C0B7L5_9ZZZZ
MACYQKQLILHKLPLPVDTLHIVYDYCFKNVIDVQKVKKAAMLDAIKNQTEISNIQVIPGYTGYTRNGHEHAFVITRCFSVYPRNVPELNWGPDSRSLAETYLSYSVCSKCGDFVNSKTKARNKLSFAWKRRCGNNEFSPFSKVTCKEENFHLSYCIK